MRNSVFTRNVLHTSKGTEKIQFTKAENVNFIKINDEDVPAEAAQTTSISIRCILANLNNMVQRFFELDQVSTTRQLSAEEKWCEDHFQQTHIRQPNDERWLDKKLL